MGVGAYVAVSAALFGIGIVAIVARRNVLYVLMGIEMILNAANINFVAFNRFLHPGAVLGQAVTIFNITVAAAEIVVGLALILSIYRKVSTVYAEDYNLLRG